MHSIKQNADAKSAYDQRLADINQSYANETHGGTGALSRTRECTAGRILRPCGLSWRNMASDIGAGATRPSWQGTATAEGGIDIVNTPTQFMAGEGGPEMAMFIPLNRALPSPIAQVVNHTGDFSHSIDAAINSSVRGLDGRIVAAVTKALSELIPR